MRTAICLLTLILAAPLLLAAETVTLRTEDGLSIKGSLYFTRQKGAPGVVALHMYQSDRKAWKPVAERFAKAGINLLAIDMRGHGESAIQGEDDLSGKVKARDPELFNAMWKDAIAARDHLVGKGADPNRIGFLGASVGCSVAIEAATRSDKTRGVCVMTPGKKYLGVDTMARLPDFGDRPMLILSSKEEAGAGASAIAKALETRAELVLYEKKGVHGTRMFGKVKGVEDRILSWFVNLLGAPAAMDGEAKEKGVEPTTVIPAPKDKLLRVYAKVFGDWLHVSFVPEKGDEAPLEIDVAWAYSGNVTSAKSIYWSAKVDAWRYRVMENREWSPVRRKKAAHRPDPSAARGKATEMLIPFGEKGVGMKKDPKLRLLVFSRGPYGDLTSRWFRVDPGD
jgi:pimeloyl-ACP methyl ester carboxylesterase